MSSFGTIAVSSGSVVQISTGGYDVLAAGTVITADSSGLTFKLEGPLIVEVQFSNDGNPARIEGNPEGPSRLKLTMWNFSNSIGSGTNAPIEIGTLKGRKLYVAFSVYAFQPTGPRTVHYTFLLGAA
ncbi:DUF6864 domain-containing function [Ralstonia holmesii]|uniref:DUF6864 domain-containing function n=1 Tax=Ralstonia TaxID=48736 RepID=UPI000B24285F|nr:hypothetical protein [Ralstonia pickettii]